MSISNEFLEFVLDQLSALAVTHKKMFGGAGLYLEGKIFGLIADKTVFLKVDDSNRKQFLDEGCKQFKPFLDKKMLMPYHEIPPTVLEDSEILCEWVILSAKITSTVQRKKKSK